MSTPPSSRGFVYVATGAGDHAEALRSAQSVRRWHPQIPICLFTDQPAAEPGPFSLILPALGAERNPIDKVLAADAPYEHCLFLDTDTLALSDLSPVFDLLERFDLAVHQDVNRGWDYQLPGVPDPFSEFNTGVIGFRRSPAVAAFFQEWRRNFLRLGQASDQPAFRQTLYHSSLRIAPLPSEFHFLSNYPNSVMWRVRLLHGRGDLARASVLVDEQLGCRAYVPEVGVIPKHHGRRSWLRFALRHCWRMLRLGFRSPPDFSAANPGKWWLDRPPDKTEPRDRADG